MEGKMSKLKIFIANHKENNYIPECDFIQPVQVGAAFSKKQFDGMDKDNTGINISEKNPMYCELTAQYWAWKNIDVEYYGFFHYRRYLSFNESLKEKVDNWNIVTKNYLTKYETNAMHIDNRYLKQIENMVDNYDVLTMKPIDLKKACGLTVYEQYKKDGVRLHVKDLDIMLEIINEKYSDFYDIAKEYLNGYTAYIGNIFIMKKELFNSYCKWLFDILNEFEKRVDMSTYSVEGYRTPGHLGERLFGIYYMWLLNNRNITSKELQLYFFSNTDSCKELQPAFSSRNIPIAMVSNDNYAPFYAAMIRSLLDNLNDNCNYDLVFLHRDFKKKTKELFLKLIKDIENVKIRFYNVGPLFEHSNLNASPTIPVETYFKLSIIEVFKKYDKVLYLDGDMIIKSDISELFQTDISQFCVAGVVDIAAAGVANGFDDIRRKYVHEKMRLKNVFKQFNAGVLLFNVSKMREEFTFKYLLEFAQGSSFQFQDQDALNVLCQDQIKWLEQSWNFMGDEVEGYRGYVETFAPRQYYLEYQKASQNPKIIHYAGNEKPWLYPKQEWADEFWNAFVRTPFWYGFVGQRMLDIENHVSNNFNGKRNLRQQVRRISEIVMPYGTMRRSCVKWIYKKIRRII